MTNFQNKLERNVNVQKITEKIRKKKINFEKKSKISKKMWKKTKKIKEKKSISEPNHARQAFPCWDEPSFKSVFHIELVVPKPYKALSNMPLSCTVSESEVGCSVLSFKIMTNIWPKFLFLTKIFIFDQNFLFWAKFLFLAKISFFTNIFDQYYSFWQNFQFLTTILSFE